MNSFTYDAGRAAQPPHAYQAELSAALLKAVSERRAGSRVLIHVATGGGKTRIANDVVGGKLLPAGKRVLWVTKDWNLVAQAAADLVQRYPVCEQVGYVGTQGNRELRGLREDPHAPMVYTTIQTWNARSESDFLKERFDVVIVDEVHWGENAVCYERLIKRHRREAVFVGLTATPHSDSSWERVGRAFPLGLLVEKGLLAAPVLARPLRTGLRWRPVRSLSHGDFTAASLRALATNRKRNALLVKTLIARREAYGPTLVFACNIEHASLLARRLKQGGLAAEAVHSDLPRDAQRQALERFRRGETQVLVNVAQLTHGVDLPTVRTIVLARPTTSPTLFSQMIGRGTRLEPGKKTFTLLDCVDEIARSQDVVIRAETFCRMSCRGTSGHRPGHASRHGYERAPFVTLPLDGPLAALVGLDVQPRQTFGLEIEITRQSFAAGVTPPDWEDVGREILRAIAEIAPAAAQLTHQDEDKDNTVWNVEWDASCGWEMTSPVLLGPEGFAEIVRVCAAIEPVMERLGLRVDRRTGLHVHLATSARPGVLRRIMEISASIEPALQSLVAPSRFDNQFCLPVRRRIQVLRDLTTLREWRAAFAEHESRYIAVNPRNALVDDGLGTMEIRLHSGTTESAKMLQWVSLWMRLIDAAERGLEVPTDRPTRDRAMALSSGPDGDIAEAARFLSCGPVLLARLVARREQVVRGSWAHHPRYAERAARALRSWARRRHPKDAA